MKNQKGFIVPLLLGIIAVLVIGGGVYIYQTQKAQAPAVDTGAQQTNSKADTSNWKTYANSKYGFSI